MENQVPPIKHEIDREREALLEQIQGWLEVPMLVLAFVWLALVIVEFVWGLSPLLEAAGYFIWALFILDFALGFTLAPRKFNYLKRNWLSGISLLAPALRIFRIVRLLRFARLYRVAGVTRSLRLLRVLSSINRGMRTLSASMSRRGFGYVALLTLIVTLAGAAGIFGFESDQAAGGGLESYGDALWWTVMLLTSIGSEYWPQTAEGRLLALFLALYGLGILGYVTATLASFFIGRDAESDEAEIAGARSIAALQAEITALREEIRGLER